MKLIMVYYMKIKSYARTRGYIRDKGSMERKSYC